MIREATFVQSHRPYAVDLASFQIVGSLDYQTGTWHRCRVEAVWFRRRQGVTVACVGELHTIQQPQPAGAAEFLTRYDDGRHGGDCKGRWDGTGYWGAQEPDVIARYLELLRPMLENHVREDRPQVPDGYDGWWRF